MPWRAPATEGPLAVILVITPRFPLLSLAACTETLRIANRESSTPLFDWMIASIDGTAVVSSSGVSITPQCAVSDLASAPVVILLTSYEPEQACDPRLLSWLRRQERQEALLACVDTAALVLARAGLLAHQRVAVHQEVAASYRETLGANVVLDRLWLFENRRLSSAGGAATLDMMLALIERVGGIRLARQVAEICNYERLPDETTLQGRHHDSGLYRSDRRLAQIVEIMQANLETPLSIATICKMAAVSSATARRLFQRYLQHSPTDYYRNIRLERARTLLIYSHLQIQEIAAATGFGDSAAFTHAFRRRFGLAPSHARTDSKQ